MNRGKHPKIELEFDFLVKTVVHFFDGREKESGTNIYLRVVTYNNGSIYTNYLNAYFSVPKWILDIPDKSFTRNLYDDEYYTPELRKEYQTIYAENIQERVIYSDSRRDSELFISVKRSDPIRHEPILPDRWHTWLIEVRDDIEEVDLSDLEIRWEIFADNSGKNAGKILLNELDFAYEKQEY